jgi:hypothetical protein
MRLILVYCFRVVSVVIGIPSLVSTIYFGWGALQIHLLHPGPLPPATGGSSALGQLMETGGRLVGGLFQLFGNLGEWFVIVISAASLMMFLFAVVLWFTADGLAEGKVWARVVAVFCGLGLLALVALVGAVRSNLQ